MYHINLYTVFVHMYVQCVSIYSFGAALDEKVYIIRAALGQLIFEIQHSGMI